MHVLIDLNPDQISKFLSMRECIERIEELYKIESDAISVQPMRAVSRIDRESIILTMPSYSKKLGKFAVKIVSEYRNNPVKFHKSVQGGTLLLFDSESSELLALMDSPRLTAIRTGAICGLATKLLSREDSEKVGVIGSGDQARALLEGVCNVREIKSASVYSRDYSHAKDFANKMRASLDMSVEPMRDRRDFGKLGNDIMIIATNSYVPVLKWEDDVSSGMHLNSVGTLPERQELDLETVRNSRVFVDWREGVLSEAGDVMNAISSGVIDRNHILGDVSDLALDKVKGRLSNKDVTLFKSVGFALLDVYAAARVFENAAEHRLRN